MRTLFWKCLSRAFLPLLLIAALGLGQVRAAGEILIYFYNPDANLRDVAKLKTEVEEYFRSIDSSANLKAFLRLTDLEAALKSQPPNFLVASSWVTKDLGARYGFKPLLVGQVGSEKSYNKVLISKKDMPQGGAPSLSMVGLGNKNVEAIKNLVPDLKKFAQVNVIEVSKDIDAVLAVSFDQVDLALVRSQNIDSIRTANASAVAGIKVLARSTPIEYPNFSAAANSDPPIVDKFLKGLQSNKDAKSAQALDLMGFQSWGPR